MAGDWFLACPINAFLSFLFFQLWVLSAGGKIGKRVIVHSSPFFFTPAVIKLILYMWFLDRIGGCLEEVGHVRRGRDLSFFGWCGQSSVSALGAELMLKVVVTVLTDTHWRRDLQSFDLWLETTAPVKEGTAGESGEWEVNLRVKTQFWPLSGQNDTINHFKRHDLLLAEELPAIPAVVTSLSEGEANRATRAAVHHLILHPVVGCRTTRLVADGPAEDSTTPVPHKDLTVVPTTTMKGGGNIKEQKKEFVLSFGQWFVLLGDSKGCDLSWVSVVLAIKRSVHGEFAPEDQLALPSVPWGHPEIPVHTQTSWIKKMGRPSIRRWIFLYVVFSVKPQIPYWPLSWATQNFYCKDIFNSCSQPTCSELVIVTCVCVGGLKRLWYWALAWIRRRRVRNFSLTFRVVDKHKAVLLINTERVWPAVRVVRAAVHRPGGTCSGWRPFKIW